MRSEFKLTISTSTSRLYAWFSGGLCLLGKTQQVPPSHLKLALAESTADSRADEGFRSFIGGLKNNACELPVIHEWMGHEWLRQDPRVSHELQLTVGQELTLEGLGSTSFG